MNCLDQIALADVRVCGFEGSEGGVNFVVNNNNVDVGRFVFGRHFLGLAC